MTQEPKKCCEKCMGVDASKVPLYYKTTCLDSTCPCHSPAFPVKCMACKDTGKINSGSKVPEDCPSCGKEECKVEHCHNGFIPNLVGGHIECEPCKSKCHKVKPEGVGEWEEPLRKLIFERPPTNEVAIENWYKAEKIVSTLLLQEKAKWKGEVEKMKKIGMNGEGLPFENSPEIYGNQRIVSFKKGFNQAIDEVCTLIDKL